MAILTVAALVFALRRLDIQATLERLLAWIHQLGAWGPALFIILYTACTVLFVPGTVLSLGAGAIFGVGLGSIYVSLGSTAGATLAFLAGRTIARDVIARRIQSNERFLAIDRAVAAEGWKIVLLTRLSPIFPFTFLNYAFGLTRIPLGPYVFASWIGMLPGTVMYVYLGSLAKASLGEHERTSAEWTLYGVGLFATIAVTAYVTKLAGRALSEKTRPERGL